MAVAYLAGLACNGGGTRPPVAPPSPEPPSQPSRRRRARRARSTCRRKALSTNDGSQGSPLDLATALSARDATPPGSAIWLRGGTYRGAFTSRLDGRADARIVVRASGGRACRAGLRGRARGTVLTVLGSYTTFQDFEVTCSTPSRVDPGRPGEPNGIYANESRNISFINLIVHDMPGQGLGIWSESMDAEVYGTIVYYNGTNRFDHGLYTQNATGTKRIEDNILFGQASHGIHAYGSHGGRARSSSTSRGTWCSTTAC